MQNSDPFDELLKRHRPMVWRMCWISAHGNYERCRDLVQEVSIALWRHFGQLRPDATLQEERAWVRWQTRSVLDFQRRMQRPTPLPLTPGMADLQAADDILEQQEELEELMSTLNDDERRMLRLQLEGYRADEIAEALGLTRDAVYQRWHRAIQRMRSIVLVLLLVAVASGLAIAVVPQWNKAVFHRSEPADELEPTPQKPKPERAVSKSDTATADTPLDTAIPLPLRQPIPLPEKLPAFLPSYVDTLPSSLPLKQRISISVNGSTVVVTGLQGERVTLKNHSDFTMASQNCYGVWVYQLVPNYGFSLANSNSYELQIGDTLCFDLTI